MGGLILRESRRDLCRLVRAPRRKVFAPSEFCRLACYACLQFGCSLAVNREPESRRTQSLAAWQPGTLLARPQQSINSSIINVCLLASPRLPVYICNPLFGYDFTVPKTPWLYCVRQRGINSLFLGCKRFLPWKASLVSRLHALKCHWTSSFSPDPESSR